MSLNTILRQKQIREMLDYDLVQNKRVFDSEIKHVESMNEAEAAPRKSDIEFEAEVRMNVDNIVLQLQKLMNAVDSVKQFKFDYSPVAVDRGVGDEGDEGAGKHKRSLKGGIKQLSEEAYKLEAEKSVSDNIAGIYSSFNSLIEKINSKLKFGYSSQGTSNILSLLQPIADGAKEVLSSAYKFKDVSPSLYNKIYSLLIEINDIIKEAPPLRRLDIVKIRDDHYQGDYDEPEVTPDARRILAEEYDDSQVLEDVIPRIESFIEQYQQEIDELQELLDENPENDEIRDLIEQNMEQKAIAEQRLAEAELARQSSFEFGRYANELSMLERTVDDSTESLRELLADKEMLLFKRDEIESTTSGKRKQTLLQGLNKKIQRLDTQILKLQSALARDKKTLKDYEGMRIKDRSGEVDETSELAQMPGRPSREEGLEGREFPLRSLAPVVEVPIRRRTRVVDMAPPPTVPGVLPQAPQPQQQPGPAKSNKPVRKGAEREARAIREEERALRQAEIAQGLPAGFLERMGPGVARTDEEAELDRIMAEVDAGLLREGYGKRRGRPSKKGGAKAMTPDQINAIVVARNKAFAANNEATQLPRAPMTYLGLKADNTRGTLGAGKKDIVMKKKDFVKEHKKLVSLLGKTGNSLKSEAMEQTNELSKFDPESAKMLEKVVDKQKMKAGKKGKKSTKMLPTLVFDDKKNDWFI